MRSPTRWFVASIAILLALQFACNDSGVGPRIRPCDPSLMASCEAPLGQWQFLGLGEETVTAIEVDPCNPRTIYVGTQFNFSAGHQGKLFKSIDCGTTWDTLIVGGSYREIVVDPFDHNTVYAVPGTILKSTNAGETWQPLINGITLNPETRVQSLAIDPRNPQVLYAGTGGFFGGTLYKSVDGGMSWRNMWNNDSLRDGGVSIAIDPKNTNTLYVGTAWRGLLVKSTDAGETWSRTGLGETGQIVHAIFVDEKETARVFAGINFEGIFVSEDAGETWRSLNEGLPQNSSVIKIQKSQIANKIFIVATSGDSGWIYQSNQTSRWEKLGIDTLRQSYYYSDLTITPTNDLYFGRKGVFRMRLF